MSSPKFDREIAATAAKRSSFAALNVLGDRSDAPPCPYRSHRSSDWRLRAGGGEKPQCGVCHPPVPFAERDVVRVNQ